MISCKHATELISKAMEEPLTFKEKCSLEIHLFICEFCEQFRTHLSILRKALSRSDEHSENSNSKTKLSLSAKDKIKAAIRKHLTK